MLTMICGFGEGSLNELWLVSLATHLLSISYFVTRHAVHFSKQLFASTPQRSLAICNLEEVLSQNGASKKICLW